MFSDQISAISYTGGTILFAIFALIAFYSGLRKRTSLTLVAPAIASSGALYFISQMGIPGYQNDNYLPIVEIIRNGAWFVSILSVLKYASGSVIPVRFYWLIHSIWLLLLLFNLIIAPLPEGVTLAKHPIVIWNGLLLAIVGLVSVEQLYRNAIHERQTKLVSVSVGALFLYDLYMYSHALVFKHIDQDLWLARGAIQGASALALCLGVITFSREQQRPNSLSISRPIVFYTTSLTMAGFFLALMAAGGYYIKLYGGDWGTVLQVLLIFSACITIASVFVSRTLRVRLSVFIDKHFFNHKYDYRMEWLKLINYLSQPSDDNFHRIAISAMASIFKSQGGCIWLLNEHGTYWPVAAIGLELPGDKDVSEPETSDFCNALREQEWVFSPGSEDTEQTSKLNELLPGWVYDIPKLWIIIPLLNEDELIGFIGLAKPPLETPLTWEDLDLLKTVGRQVSSYLTRHQAAELLAQSKQFDAFNKLTAFVMHDLKNLIAQQALVVKNAAKHKDNPAFIEDMINTIDNSVNRMNNLLQKLQQKESAAKSHLFPVDLDRVLLEAVTKCQERYPIPSMRLNGNQLKVLADNDRLEMVLIHIIKNAQEATPKEGFVDVTLKRGSKNAIIEIEDNGSGMDEEFVKNRLFKPFDTTKSGKGMGIGVYQAREFLVSIGGEITVHSEMGHGSLFRISIPLQQ